MHKIKRIQLNIDLFFTEFRRYMNEKYPSILEGFYKFGEFFDKDALAHIREVDLATFEAKKKNSTTKSQ